MGSEIAGIVKKISHDERVPCRYSGALALDIHSGYRCEAVAQPQVPFVVKRIIVTKPGIVIGRICIGVRLAIQVAYRLDIVSDLLLPEAFPIEWEGIDRCLPGMDIRLQAESPLVDAKVIMLGDAYF